MISLLQICFSVQYLKTQKTNKKAIQQLLTITTQENLRQLEYTTFLKIAPKFRLYTKSGAWKNSSPGFQFLYAKSQISNIIKV